MLNSTKFSISIIVITVAFLVVGSGYVCAQEDTSLPLTEAPIDDITQMVDLDENIKAEDLEISEPKILPDSPFYLFKEIGRGIRSVFTFNPVKKAELKQRFADERLMEIKKLAEMKPEETEILNRAFDGYKAEMGRLKKITEKIKAKADTPDVEAFMDKFIDHNLKHQKLFGKFEKELPPKSFEMIEKIKEENIAKFSDIGLGLASPKVFQEKIVEVLEKAPGSSFKHFKNLEVLQELEESVSEPAKEAIRIAQDNALNCLRSNFEIMPAEEREKFDDYVEHIGGNEVRHMEIIHRFEAEEIPKIMREEMEKAKEIAFERIEKRMKDFEREKMKHQKEMFIKHLKDGEMEDLRIIKELENNLAPETVDKILEVKNKAMMKFKDRIMKAETPEEQKAFLEKIERFHDVKQLELFKEMEEFIPEEKKEFWEKMKNKAMEEMKKDIERGRTERERMMKLEKLAGDAPEHIAIIEEFGPAPKIKAEIMKKQIERLKQKIETVEDAEKLEFLKRKIEEDERIKKELENRDPRVIEKIKERENFLLEGMKPEKALERIEEAKKEIITAEEEFAALDSETKNEITQRTPFQVLLANAQKKLEAAQIAYDEGIYGRAFGLSNAAFHEANNALRIIKEISLRQEWKDKQLKEKLFEKEMKKREKFERKFRQEFPLERIPLPGEFKERIISSEQLPKEEQLKEEQLKEEQLKEEQLMPMPEIRRQIPQEKITPEGKRICIEIWDPVCGVDNKTYSNECFAKIAGVEIAHKGVCKEEPMEKIKPIKRIEKTEPMLEHPTGDEKDEKFWIEKTEPEEFEKIESEKPIEEAVRKIREKSMEEEEPKEIKRIKEGLEILKEEIFLPR